MALTDLHFGPTGGQRAAGGKARSRPEGTPAAVPMRWHSKYFAGGIFMRKITVRDLVLAAMAAALYAVERLLLRKCSACRFKKL